MCLSNDGGCMMMSQLAMQLCAVVYPGVAAKQHFQPVPLLQPLLCRWLTPQTAVQRTALVSTAQQQTGERKPTLRLWPLPSQ